MANDFVSYLIDDLRKTLRENNIPESTVNKIIGDGDPADSSKLAIIKVNDFSSKPGAKIKARVNRNRNSHTLVITGDKFSVDPIPLDVKVPPRNSFKKKVVISKKTKK